MPWCQELPKKFPGAEFAFDAGGMLTAALNMGLPSPINIQVKGSNLDTSVEIARIIHSEAQKVPGAVDVRIAQRMDYPQLDVEIDRIKTARLGINVEEVVKNLVTATNSSINFAPAFWIDEKNGNHYFIGAQYYEKDIKSIDTLKDIPLTSFSGKTAQSGTPPLLRNLATFKRSSGPNVVNHYNITRVIDIFANVKKGYDSGTVALQIEKRLENSPELRARTKGSGVYEVLGSPRNTGGKKMGKYEGKGYTFEMRGEVYTMRKSFSQFLGGLVIAIALIYLVMVAQFRSFLDPLVIMSGIPLGLIGVGWLLYFSGSYLNIPSFMGIIMMSGIVVQYGLLLIDFANRGIGEGLSPKEAIVQAAELRIRPILMTSITAVLTLLPIAIGFEGGEANAPLARAIIGGVLAATVLTLFVMPVLYITLKGGEKVSSPEVEKQS